MKDESVTDEIMKMKLLTKLRTWGLLLPLILSFSSCVEHDDDTIPKQGYYQIPTESLGGWHKGVCYFDGSCTSCNYYIVSCTDSIDGSVTVCLNTGRNSDVGKAIAFHLASNGDVLKVIALGVQFNGLSNGEEVEFTVYDDKGDIAGYFTVPYIMVEETASPLSASFKIMDYSQFTDKAWEIVGDSLKSVLKLDEKVLRNAVSDYLSGKIDCEFLTMFKGQTLFFESVADLFLKYYEQEKASYMGDANIEIVATTQTSDSTITIEGRIVNISSIPTCRQTIHEGVVVDVENKVLFGVAVGRELFPGFQSNEACTKLETVSEECFSFTVNLKTKPGKNYHFRPFLIPEHKVHGEMKLLPDDYICIRYSEAAKFMNFNLDFVLSNFRQVKCIRDGAGYEAQFTIDGKIPYLFDGMENWGVVVRTKTDSYAMAYYAQELEWDDLPTEKNFKCKLRPIGGDVIESGVNRFSEFTITPFVEFKDTIINLDSKDYTFLVEGGGCPDSNHPHVIDLGLSVKWSCCNIDTSDPWDYGHFYAWGEIEKKGYYSATTYKYVRDLDEDGDYMDDDANWIDIGTNISGTSYDVAHVKWGNGWRMPTYEEVEELKNECIWKWSNRGFQITGPDGRNIFLPVAYTSDTGYYWTGTLSCEEGGRCNAYYFYFNRQGTYGCSWDYRHCGFLVRPVKD